MDDLVVCLLIYSISFFSGRFGTILYIPWVLSLSNEDDPPPPQRIGQPHHEREVVEPTTPYQSEDLTYTATEVLTRNLCLSPLCRTEHDRIRSSVVT